MISCGSALGVSFILGSRLNEQPPPGYLSTFSKAEEKKQQWQSYEMALKTLLSHSSSESTFGQRTSQAKPGSVVWESVISQGGWLSD